MKFSNNAFLILTWIIFSCNSEDVENEQIKIDPVLLELGDSSYYLVEEQNERGLLKTSFFSNNHSGLDKIMEGSDNNHNYLLYGESVFLENQQIFVPQNIKHVVQMNPQSQSILNIELDENYFPIKFEPKIVGSNEQLIYTIDYGVNHTKVKVEKMREDGTISFIKNIDMPFIERTVQNSTKFFRNKEDCKSIEKNMESFDICKTGNVYEEFGDNFENYTDDTWISMVGEFANFLVKEMKKLSCSTTPQTKVSFCEQLKFSKQNYIKLLNSGEVFGVYGDVDNLQSYSVAGQVWSAGLHPLISERPKEWPFLNRYFTSFSMEHCYSENCALTIEPLHPYEFSRMSMNLAYENITDVRQVDVSEIYRMDFITKAGTALNGIYSDSYLIGFHLTGMCSQGPFELHNYDGGLLIR